MNRPKLKRFKEEKRFIEPYMRKKKGGKRKSVLVKGHYRKENKE